MPPSADRAGTLRSEPTWTAPDLSIVIPVAQRGRQYRARCLTEIDAAAFHGPVRSKLSLSTTKATDGDVLVKIEAAHERRMSDGTSIAPHRPRRQSPARSTTGFAAARATLDRDAWMAMGRTTRAISPGFGRYAKVEVRASRSSPAFASKRNDGAVKWAHIPRRRISSASACSATIVAMRPAD